MLTLAIGDLFIPDRAIDIPAKFKKLLSPNPDQFPSNNKLKNVICLGNVSSNDTLSFLYNLSPSFHIVKGEYDDIHTLSQQYNRLLSSPASIPLYNVITQDNLKIGFTSGYQIVPKSDPLSLSALARELDVDILIWGGTHKVEAYTLDGKFFVNPGSATGSYTFDWPDNDDDEEEEEEEEGDVKAVNEVDVKNNQEEKTDLKEEKSSKEGGEDAKNKGLETSLDSVAKDASQNDSASSKPKSISEINRKPETTNSTEFDQDLLDEVVDLNSNIPSFCLLDIEGSLCTLYIYTYINDEVKVDKVSYNKDN